MLHDIPNRESVARRREEAPTNSALGTLRNNPYLEDAKTTMAREFERKFLIADDGWRESVTGTLHCIQGYLASSPTSSVRVRIAGERAWLNLKSAELGVSRYEFEYAIPLADARDMLAHLCGGRFVEKTRYYVPHDAHTWEIDVFAGDNDGLVIAEIELAAPDQDFERPPWLGAEVSHDARFYNINLINNPFKDW